MMEKLRPFIASFMNTIGKFFYRLRITPTFFTMLGLFFSLIAGYFYWQHMYWGALLFVLIAGFMDMIDGAIAKQYTKRTKAGSLMDSIIDRLSEVAIYIGITLSFQAFFSELIAVLTLVFSLLVSYIRARVESLGGEMRGVGLMERGERILGLIIISMIAAFKGETAFFIGLFILMTLIAFTVIQRFIIGLKRLNHSTFEL